MINSSNIDGLNRRPDDCEIIREVLKGNDSLYTVLVERYKVSVATWIGRIVTDTQEKEDLVQETFVNAWQRLKTLQDHSRFSSWLRTIAINNALMWYRRNGRQLTLSETPLSINELESEGMSDNEWKMKMALRSALDDLTVDHRKVIEHHYYRGHSYVETARRLSISVDTVRSRLQKARSRIRKEIDTMTTKNIDRHIIELNRTDLQMLRAAAEIRLQNAEYLPAIQGLLITDSGEIVGMDAHMVLMRSSDNDNLHGRTLLLGECRPDVIPDADHATLLLGTSEALLKTEGNEAIAFPILHETYPEYKRFIPPTFNTIISVEQRPLLQLLDSLLATESENRIEVSLRIQLRESTMEVSSEPEGFAPSFHLPIQLLQVSENDHVCWTCNALYLRRLVDSLGLGDEGQITLAIGFNGNLEAIVMYNARDMRQRAILAPIRRADL